MGFCSLCKKTINVTWNGITAIKSHNASSIHQQQLRARGEQLSMSLFCGASSSSTSITGIVATQANATSPAGTSAAIDGQTVLPSQFQTSSLRAEVLWCLNTAAKHNSYNSNEGIGAVFASMFTDFQIASSFACGKDKTAFMIGFGIAPHFKKLLTNSVNDYARRVS